jgi:hypothetical protein
LVNRPDASLIIFELIEDFIVLMVEKDEFMGREYLKGVELALQVKKFKV